MKETDMNEREDGFMIAIGLLLDNTEAPVRNEILKTLESFGDDLHEQLNNQTYAANAADAGINPCPAGYQWDPVNKVCVLE